MLPLLQRTDFPAIRRQSLDTLQVNLGYRCNQRCVHCHVNAGPHRTEMMDRRTIELIPRVLHQRNVRTLDLTGGAPELHDDFRWLVGEAAAQGVCVVDRCNLTVLFEEGQQDLARFLAAHQVQVVASLPCYSLENVDAQRGKGVFDKSIAALQRLNQLGYGHAGTRLVLDLVYNPQGPTLPPDQQQLEDDYRRELRGQFGITFNHLFVLANMPVNRFGSMLVSTGQFDSYMRLLKDSYRPANLDSVMCRRLVSVDWRGHLYDCDFNQQMGLPLTGGLRHLRDLLHGVPARDAIAVADHCYGCTAGQGSSCTGALQDNT